MVVFNYSTRELTTKIVYYGPGLCGKTTNLQFIYDSMPQGVRGKMLSLATKSDRTLFFDFLPIDLGEIQGMKTKVQLYTVPGQVFYNETRRLVLKGADGIVFVADSQENMLDANLDSFKNLEENLQAHGMDLSKTPHVLQFNKQDLPNALPVDVLNEKLNRFNVPFYEAVATTGVGVHETLKHITKLVLLHLNDRYSGGRGAQPQPSASPSRAQPPAAAAAAPAEPEAAAPAFQPTLVDQPALRAEESPVVAAAVSEPVAAPVAQLSQPVSAPVSQPEEPSSRSEDEFSFEDAFVDETGVQEDEPTGRPAGGVGASSHEHDANAAPALATPSPEAPAVATNLPDLPPLPDPAPVAAELQPSLPDLPPALDPSPVSSETVAALPELPPAVEVASPAALSEAPLPATALMEPGDGSVSPELEFTGPPPANANILGVESSWKAASSAAAAVEGDDILDVVPPPPARVLGGTTIKIDRKELAGLIDAAPEAAPPVAQVVAQVTEVGAADALFEEAEVEATQLCVGAPQEILIPLEVQTPEGPRRFRLTLRLDLAP